MYFAIIQLRIQFVKLPHEFFALSFIQTLLARGYQLNINLIKEGKFKKGKKESCQGTFLWKMLFTIWEKVCI